MARIGISARQYALRRGVSAAAVSYAIRDGRITPEADGSIIPAKADAQWDALTDPAKQRFKEPPQGMPLFDAADQDEKPVSSEHLAEVDAALSGIPKEDLGGQGPTMVKARLANELIKASMNRLKLRRAEESVVPKDPVIAMVFELGRRERDAWQNWPTRVAAIMAAELRVDPHTMQTVLDKYIRKHLSELSELTLPLGGKK